MAYSDHLIVECDIFSSIKNFEFLRVQLQLWKEKDLKLYYLLYHSVSVIRCISYVFRECLTEEWVLRGVTCTGLVLVVDMYIIDI